MAAERLPGDIGSIFREARERRGATLREIAGATKIPVGALEALERNDTARLPGGIFSRAFVRAYAVEVGLDPESTLLQFTAQFPQDAATVGHPASKPLEDNDAVESERRIASTVLGLFALSLPIAGVVLYFGAAGMRRPDAPLQAPGEASMGPSRATAAISSPGVETQPASAPVAVPAVSRIAGDPPSLQTANRLLVGLSATRVSWVSATVDGLRVIGREMKTGERQVLEVNRNVILSFGDAGAINVSLNGAPTRPLGPTGQVVTVEMNPDNFKTFLAVP